VPGHGADILVHCAPGVCESTTATGCKPEPRIEPFFYGSRQLQYNYMLINIISVSGRLVAVGVADENRFRGGTELKDISNPTKF
jgi:hypothetical protein